MDGRMRVLLAIAGMAILHSSGVWFDHSALAGTSLPKKANYTSKSHFRIPFNSDAASMQRMNTIEIQLYVSRDSGATWELAQTVTPDGGKFEYKAPAEGVYWFAVKTLDGQNQLHPSAGKYETGLIVVVDSTQPVLDLSLNQSSRGKLQVRWHASDPNVDSSSLKIEYLDSASNRWETAAIPSQLNGEAELPIHQAGLISVRASIADHAGNVGQANSQIKIESTSEPAGRVRPTLDGPVADSLDIGTTAAKSDSSSPIKTPSGVIAEREYRGPIITPQGGLPRYSPQNQPAISQAAPPQPKGQFVSNVRTTGQEGRLAAANVETSINPPVAPPTQPEPTAVQPIPQPQMPVQPQFTENTQRRFPQPPLQRMVPSRRFQLGYEIDNVGPSGVSGVELFITEDSGRKWYKYGDDPDQKSPFDVELPRDGVYGFAIRSRSGVGLSTALPVPGEPPEIVVAVDQTAPVVELLPVEQGRGPNANQLRIRWRIQESFPAEKPVLIQYAPSPAGPWIEVGSWREDMNGTFVWTVGPGIPAQVYLKVMARDAVGNFSSAETPAPIIVDLQRPTARIVEIGVDPVSAPR